jgi:glycosyltransferase involved in cell wall biosynthesis
MKPLLINTLSSGGAAKACIRLHEGLMQQGIESELLTLQNGSQHIKNHTRYPQDGWRSLYHLFQDYKQKALVKIAGVEAFEFIRSPYRIQELELYHQADVINFHWTNRFLDYPSFFKENTKPVIWTLHDMQSFSGGYPYDSEINLKLFKRTIQNNINEKLDLLTNQNIHIVCLSKWMMNESKKSKVFKRFPHYLIPNGIDTSIYRYQDKLKAKKKLGLNTDKKMILFVSATVDHKRKGFQFLSEALDHPSMAHIDLMAVGSMPTSSNQKIRSTGYIKEEKRLAEIYAAADLFVIPSIEDNLPNTVVESLCCGTPVVGFNIGGIPDMVTHGVNGLIANQIDAIHLRKQILNALEMHWDTENISHQAHRKYALNVQSTSYLQLFQRTLH